MQNANSNASAKMTNEHRTGDVGKGNKHNSPSADKKKLYTPTSHDFLDICPSDDDEASEVESFVIDQDELDDDDTSRFLLSSENLEDDGEIRTVDPETHARLEALLEAAGLGKLSTADGKAFADPEVLRRLTSSVSCALDEAAAALTRMRAEQQAEGASAPVDSTKTLAQACSSGDIGTVRQLLDEGRSVHETTEEGESLLSLACSAGYYELAQVLLAMRANVEDRGIKGDCTPLMEAASGGYVEIVKLLITHGADVNAQSSAGNTPLHYAACGGHEAVVRVLIDNRANVEEHNENGHTPLMEAASAGHVGVAKLLLESGAGINTHSNEFKESALTLACYKGHLEMVKFLLEAGADHEHKTDEMHTALMEACMDGHVEVARLLLDSGAHVNMPIDSFESPLTLAACGGHVELANLLIERGANLEEVNDEGYTPLMEASREGHEEMVALLLAHGADINGQTEETQETALTLACCGGFQEVADFLIKAGADMELGCSTPLMEAAQEGHLELVKYLIKVNANVHQQTQTGDTALTYACENGHTDVAEVLLEANAELEHESEGGRTPLMKAARAGHLCTVQFLIGRGADVNKATSTNDHTVLSLACAGGHLPVVELLLRHGSDSTHKLKDGSTMLIEAAKGGHTTVVNLLLDWPSSMLSPTAELNTTTLSPPQTSLDVNQLPRVPIHGLPNFVPPQDPNKKSDGASMTQVHTSTQQQAQALVQQVQASVQYGQQTVPTSVRDDLNVQRHSWEQIKENMKASLAQKKRITSSSVINNGVKLKSETKPKTEVGKVQAISGDTVQDVVDGAAGGRDARTVQIGGKSSLAGGAQVGDGLSSSLAADIELSFADAAPQGALGLDGRQDMKASERLEAFINKMMQKAELLNTTREEQIMKKQQILEELQKVEQELQEKAKLHMILNAQQQLETEKLRQKQLELQDIERREVPKPPSEVSSLDRDGENLDDIVYVYEPDDDSEDNYDVDDDDDVIMTEDMLRERGGIEGFLPEGLTEEQVRECEERLNQAVRLEMEKLDERFSEKLKLNASAAQLTCAPDPVPLHIALTNDLQNQLGISSIAASLPSRSSEITKMANESSTMVLSMNDNGGTAVLFNGPLDVETNEEDDEPQPSDDNTVRPENENRKSKRGTADGKEQNTRPKLAKQESLSSVNSDVEDGGAVPEVTELTNGMTANEMAAAVAERLRTDMILTDGTPVDLTYFTPPEGSPERAGSNESAMSQEVQAQQSAQSSRASSEEVDLSNVMPVVELETTDGDHLQLHNDAVSCQQGATLTPQQLQLLQQQLQQHQLLQQRLAIAKDRRLAAAVSAVVTPHSGMPNANATSVIVANPQQLQANNLAAAAAGHTKLMIPVQLDPLTAAAAQAITPANAAAIQKQLEQQRQQLQLVLQQQLQHELQQQLKLQQEHEQLKQQLEAHQAQVALQQKQLQAQTNKMKGNQAKIQQATLNISTTTTTLESLQQEINQQELQHLKLQQVQQHLQQLHQQLQQVQQLQNNHQLTQQELLQQAQHLHQQLQQAQLQQFAVQQQQGAQAAASQLQLQTGTAAAAVQGVAAVQTTGIVTQPLQVNQQMAHLLSQPDLLQQAQHLAQVQQRQQNAALQQQAVIQNLAVSGATVVGTVAQQRTLSSNAASISAVATLPISAVQTSGISNNNVVVSHTAAAANITNLNNINITNSCSPKIAKKSKKKHNLFNQQQLQLQATSTAAAANAPAAALALTTTLDPQQLQQQQSQLQQLHMLQQQQLQQQLQQQQQLYQLQQQQYTQHLGQQHPQILNNSQLAQQIVDYSTTVANNVGIPHSQLYNYYLDLVNQSPNGTVPNGAAAVVPNPSPASPQVSPPVYPSVELDAQTESNHDTALTLACAGGHAELVSLLLSRGAEIEHRDKKGFTPLILASTAGHTDIVEILLDHGADIEAQSERTKDTPLSLACSGGRYEVVELLLQRGANKEHRNVSDYTPLSLAASGGYVNIIKLLLSYNAEINSRTGSKLGISPLMLAAMNGHTAAVKLLLDMGSDINAQIETNRNTALTLACFQGRHEVVSLLVDRKANIEHRAKTGLTPLMEAASGGYVEVGRVLLDKGADVNASPVPSSKDTALTIAADKGHFRFVELLINKHAAIDVRNKKGNSPLWLACNGGHLDVAQLLVNAKADVDSQDNRKVSCLMAAFRKGHIKCVKWMVKHVTQFPSDQECMRFIQTVTDKELLKKCHQCMEIIVSAKDRQAAEANKNASILLEEIESERSREETKRERAARKREKRRQKKKEKAEKERSEKEEKEREEQVDETKSKEDELTVVDEIEPIVITKSETAASTSTKQSNKNNKNRSVSPANSLSDDNLPDVCRTQMALAAAATQSLSNLETTGEKQQANNASNNNKNRKKKKGSKSSQENATSSSTNSATSSSAASSSTKRDSLPEALSMSSTNATNNKNTNKIISSTVSDTSNDKSKSNALSTENTTKSSTKSSTVLGTKGMSTLSSKSSADKVVERNNTKNIAQSTSSASTSSNKVNKKMVPEISTTGIGDLDDFGALPSQMSGLKISSSSKKDNVSANDKKNVKTQKKVSSMDSIDIITPMKQNLKVGGTPSPKKGGSKREDGWKEVIRRSKKIVVPSNAVSRVIGRQGVNVTAIKEVSGANIDIDRAKSGDRTLTIKGPADATKRAYDLLSALIKDPDKDVEQLIPKVKSNKQVLITNTLTMSSNVWHNSMANHITTASQIAASQNTPTQNSSKVPTTVTRLSSATTVSITTTASRPVVSGGKSTMSHINNGTAIWGNPGQPPAGLQPQTRPQNATISMFAAATSVNYTPEKSPSIVSRQLFPKDGKESSQQAQNNGVHATYSSPSMAKTKLVDAAPPAFSTKENTKIATVGAIGNNRPQRSQVAPIARPPVSVQQGTNFAPGGQRVDPQPLPIKAPGPGQNAPSSRTQLPVPNTSASAVGEFSPLYSNLFNLAQDVLGGKKEEEPMNFASVAAQGVVTSTNSSSYSDSVSNSLNVTIAESVQDPSKIVGYKAPGQRTSSPQIATDPNATAELQSRTPGFRGVSQFNPMVGGQLPNQQLQQHLQSGSLIPGGQMEAFANHPTFMHMNPPDLSRFRFPGAMPPGGMPPPQSVGEPHFSKAPGHNKPSSGPPSQNMSPRSSSSTPVSLMNDQSPRSSLRATIMLRNDDEYSSPHTPMTLPKIDSKLNPNAPHFMSRHPQSGLDGPPMPQSAHHMNQPPPSLASIGIQPPLHPAFRPSYSSVPPPSMGVNPGGDINLNELQNLLMGNLMGPRSESPHSTGLSGRASHTGMQPQPSSKDDSLGGDNGGSGMGVSSHDFPRPIGTERVHKGRAHTPGAFPGDHPPPHLDELGAGLWPYSDVPSDWLATMTSMVTTTVVTNTLATSSLSVNGEQRPHSQPSFNTHLPVSSSLRAPYEMLQHLEQGIQPSQRGMYNASPQAVFASNGSVGGLGGLPTPGQPQAPSQSGTVESLWSQPPTQLPGGKVGDAGVDIGLPSSDPKLAWSNWSQAPSNP